MTATTDLAAIHSLAEFEGLARERMEPAAYDYVAGGSWDELTLADNEAAWRRWRLRPRVLVDVERVDAAREAFGRRLSMPVAIAPMAAQALAHPDAEVAMARAAASAGIPFCLSTVSSCSIEEVARGAPDAIRWFQLYEHTDRTFTRRLCERAAEHGYDAVLLTVDLPVVGYRERDRRHGFELDVHLGNFPGGHPGHGGEAETGYEALGHQRHLALGWADVATVRGWSGLPVVLKGIMTAEDARLAVEHGADAIVVSNHGARQLDRVLATADVLEEVVDAVGARLPVWVDGGIRRGLDVLVALALGADGVLIGRPMYWALAAGGEAGVARALAILREESELGMALLGARTLDGITRDHLARERRPMPAPSGRTSSSVLRELRER
jgi:isopentenyl diphosphate isomerase/L-lactate dehydrogenase-like FMN-dependent dehydrogenase